MQHTCIFYNYQLHFRYYPSYFDVGITKYNRKSVFQAVNIFDLQFSKITRKHWILSILIVMAVAPILRGLYGMDPIYYVNTEVSIALYYAGVLGFGYYTPVIRNYFSRKAGDGVRSGGEMSSKVKDGAKDVEETEIEEQDDGGRNDPLPDATNSGNNSISVFRAIITLAYIDFLIVPLRITYGWSPSLPTTIDYVRPTFLVLDACLTFSLIYFVTNTAIRPFWDEINWVTGLKKKLNEYRFFSGIDNNKLLFNERIRLEGKTPSIIYISVLHLYEEISQAEQEEIAFKLDELKIKPVEKGDIIAPKYRDAVPVIVTSDLEVRSLIPPKYVDVSFGILGDELQNPFEELYRRYGLSLEDNKIVTSRGNIFFADYDLIERFVNLDRTMY